MPSLLIISVVLTVLKAVTLLSVEMDWISVVSCVEISVVGIHTDVISVEETPVVIFSVVNKLVSSHGVLASVDLVGFGVEVGIMVLTVGVVVLGASVDVL